MSLYNVLSGRYSLNLLQWHSSARYYRSRSDRNEFRSDIRFYRDSVDIIICGSVMMMWFFLSLFFMDWPKFWEYGMWLSIKKCSRISARAFKVNVCPVQVNWSFSFCGRNSYIRISATGSPTCLNRRYIWYGTWSDETVISSEVN